MRIIISLFAIFFSNLMLAGSLNNIVVFGDSLSDNGNLYEYMGHKIPKSPPYYKGRFTNGPVWVEQLTKTYFPGHANAHLFDYAFGGAGVSDEGDETLFTLRREMDIYLSSHSGKADKNSLFVVWIGANNYIGMPENNEEMLNAVDKGMRHDLQRLINAGAKHLLIVNLPDLGQTPIAKQLEAQGILSYLSHQHNERLLNTVNALQQANSEAQLVYFDVHHEINEMLKNPESYGFSNTSETCYSTDVEKLRESSVLGLMASVKVKKKSTNCTGYLFFDPVHPTVFAHKLLAENAKRLLDSAGIDFEK